MKSSVIVMLLPVLALAALKTAPPSTCSQIMSGAMPAATAQPVLPAKYRLTTEYNLIGPVGDEGGTHVVSGDFTLDAKSVQWTSVTTAQSPGEGQPAGPADHQRFMEGMQYPRSVPQNGMGDAFFKPLPPAATDEKNLVLDEVMFRVFVEQNLDKLRINQPVVVESGTQPLSGGDTFTNRRVELTWIGIGTRDSEDCALIHYEALLNRFKMDVAPMTIAARSDYMGDIWVSIRTRQIVYATLLEEIAGQISNIPNSPGPAPLHLLRLAKLEKL